MIHPQFLISQRGSKAAEVNSMAVPTGLLFIGLVIRAVWGALVVAGVVFLCWKLGKLAEAYTDKIKAK